ncbi:MAG TPA: histidine kinase [Chitinophagaceae bacterium]
MQRIITILAILLISATSRAQDNPIVNYVPKAGYFNNSLRENYKNRLHRVPMEDTILLINKIHWTGKDNLYIVTDQGLYLFDRDKFVMLPLKDHFSFFGHDLQPGDYTLNVRATFPSDNYQQQIVRYSFSIKPAWWQTWWFRAVIGLMVMGFVIFVIRFYYSRKLEIQKTVLERNQAIEKERTRIATDMHDDLGAGLSRIKFLSEGMRMKRDNKDALLADIGKISAYSDEMAEKMGEIVWALNEQNDTVADLVAFTRSYAIEYLTGHNIHCNSSTPLNLPETFIKGEVRQHIFLAVKECLHNIVKHANASEVNFSITLGKKIVITVHDNGKGIILNSIRPFSNGLQNIQRRMKEIQGTVLFDNQFGTKVILSVPV